MPVTLETPSERADTHARPSEVAAPRSGIFAIGEVLSDTYVVRELLGAGGMGEVYEAHDLVLNRRVAIKAHQPSLAATFPVRKEAQALAAVRDPTVVAVYTVGTHRGIDYVVMERIHGVSLATHFARRFSRGETFTIDETLDILGRLAQGLATVHDAGIAHRDVKPGNIMLGPSDRVVLMDFGIFIPEIDVRAQSTTPGTAQYMAPEAIRGDVKPGTAYLVDLYAFGIIAYEMLAGSVPFIGKTTPLTLLQHLDAPVPSVLAARRDAPPALAALIESLLAKDPLERPQSMEAVAWQLRGIRDRVDRTSIVSAQDEYSVLIVDDDVTMAETLDLIVAEALPNALVRVAHHPAEALTMVRRRPPDLMILDLMLPEMNGIEVCMYLRGARLAERTRIVSVSAGALPQDVELLRQLGITHFVRKGTDLLDRLVPLLRTLRAEA